MNISYYVNKIRKLSFAELVNRIWTRILNKISIKLQYAIDCVFSTYRQRVVANANLVPIEISWDKLALNRFNKEISKELWRMYKEHRFDLLGSGWVNAGYGQDVTGFEGTSYVGIGNETDKSVLLKKTQKETELHRANSLLNLISSGYKLIDWQRDHKSGYSWSAKFWYKPVRIAESFGGDIKMPWELSRLQHLVRFPILYHFLVDQRNEIINEYCDQLIDFIIQNPIRRGVNYMCTMDVGIRVANISMSYSLFRSLGVSFSGEFESVLCNFIYQNCEFIVNNLEKSVVYNSNHYFSDITGLLFGASIIPLCKERAKWLCFSINEINSEIKKQFNEEGTNKEGSIAYHRLTTELALYSVVLATKLHETEKTPSISDYSKQIVIKACLFLNTIIRPDGMFPSIGDNDAGQLFRFSYTGELITPRIAVRKYHNLKNYRFSQDDKYYYDENLCDPRTLIAAGYGYSGIDYEGDFCFEYSLLKQMSGDYVYFEKEAVTPFIQKQYKKLGYSKKSTVKFDAYIDVDSFLYYYFEQFGLALIKNSSFYLCISLANNGQNGLSGHSHNDKLSFELIVDGKIIFEDPGTYVYTADLKERNIYRSVHSHNTINVGIEQNSFINTFRMEDETKCEILEFGYGRFVGCTSYSGILHIREIEVFNDHIVVTDSCNNDFETNFKKGLHTRGYGKSINEVYFDEEMLV